MTNVPAKLSVKGKRFEILVDVEKALAFRQGKPVSMQNILANDVIFSDMKKGLRASGSDLKAVFNTEDVYVAAERIIKNGEIEIPSELRAKEQENKVKQVIDFLSRNVQDPATGKPHSASRIQDALKQIGVNIDSRSIEEQIPKILDKLRVILPLKIESKKLEVRIPAVHTGKAYGLLTEYKEKEEWLGNGDLLVVINIPAGMQMAFYDKLNAVTHGAALVEEVKK